MATDDRRRPDEFPSRRRLPRLRYLRRKIEGEGALLNGLEPRNQTFVVSRIELLDSRTMRLYSRATHVNMCRFRCVMVPIGSLIVDMKTKRPTALLFAGSGSHTVANHLDPVLTSLGVAIVV